MQKPVFHWWNSILESVEQDCHKSCWQPACDVYRTSTGWLVKFDLAGVQQSDLSVSVSGRVLSVHGCRKDTLVARGVSHQRLEIAYSRFRRSVELPADLESAQLNMEMVDGMLLVQIDCPSITQQPTAEQSDRRSDEADRTE